MALGRVLCLVQPGSTRLNQVQPRFADGNYHRKRVGLDHLAFRLSSKEEILKLRESLLHENIPILYDAGFYGPEYFAIYFEDPDRIKLEFGFDTAGRGNSS